MNSRWDFSENTESHSVVYFQNSFLSEIRITQATNLSGNEVKIARALRIGCRSLIQTMAWKVKKALAPKFHKVTTAAAKILER